MPRSGEAITGLFPNPISPAFHWELATHVKIYTYFFLLGKKGTCSVMELLHNLWKVLVVVLKEGVFKCIFNLVTIHSFLGYQRLGFIPQEIPCSNISASCCQWNISCWDSLMHVTKTKVFRSLTISITCFWICNSLVLEFAPFTNA